MIEQSEGRKLCGEALREIESGRSDFIAELHRFREAKKTSEKDGPGCRHWTIAERLLKKADREAKEAAKSSQPAAADEKQEAMQSRSRTEL